MSARNLLAGGVIGVGLLVVSLTAQQPIPPAPAKPGGQPQLSFRTGVNLVLVDVSVLDADRRPVRGLTAADFTVLEDGKPQAVQTFSAIDVPDAEPPAPAAAPWLREVAPDVRRNDDQSDRRINVLLLDDATPMLGEEVPRVKALARGVIDRLGPGDLTSVVFALNKSAGQDFTQDRARLLASIDRFNGNAPVDKLVDGKSVPVEFDELAIASFPMYQSALNTLRSVAEYLADLPQRHKTLIYVSPGLPLDPETLGTRQNLNNGDDTVGLLRALLHRTEEVFTAARQANVSAYCLDPGGLRPPRVTRAGSLSLSPGKINREFLQALSDNTGGLTVTSTNDPAPGIAQIFAENSSYYLLGYQSSNAKEGGGARKVDVRVNRPGVMVRARSSYQPPKTEKPKSAPPPSPLWKALADLVPKADVALQVSAAPFALPGRREAGLAVVVGLRQPAPAGTERIVENVDLAVAAYDLKGDPRGSERLKARVVLRPVGGQVGYEVLSRLDLAPGRYQLRLAAQSSMQGKTGSVYYDVDVPDFGKEALSLSGVVLTAEPPQATAPKDRLVTLVPVVPTTRREFAGSDHVAAFLRVYQGGKGLMVPVTLSARVMDATGATMFDRTETLGPDRFARNRSSDCRVDLPLAQMKSGPLVLTIRATAGKRTASRDVRFAVFGK